MRIILVTLIIIQYLACTPATVAPVGEEDSQTVGPATVSAIDYSSFLASQSIVPICANASEDGVFQNTTVSFEWEDLSAEPTFQLFNVRFKLNNVESDDITTTETPNFSLDLSEGDSIVLYMQVEFASGDVSDWSESATCTVDTVAPTAPTNLETKPDSITDIDSRLDDDTVFFMTWSAATDPMGSGILDYTVTVFESNDCTGSPIVLDPTPNLHASYTGVISSTYTYFVTARDRALLEATSVCSPLITLSTPVVPTVNAVTAPTKANLNRSNPSDSFSVDVTCSHNGYASILNNSNDAEILGWTAVVAATPATLTVSTQMMSDSGANSDGSVTLKVFCRSPVSTLSAPDTSQSINLVTPGPIPPLDDFSAATGTVTDGDIVITIDYPADTSVYDNVVIRRIAGTTAPDGDCTSDGTTVTTINAPFIDGNITDATGSIYGEEFSYRACITDTGAFLASDDTITGVQARDTAAPAALASFTGVTGATSDGDIDLSWTFPGSTLDYDRVSLRRIAGSTAPNADCTSDGTEILQVNAPFSTTSYTDATGSLIGESFSYRACVFDSSDNLTSTNSITNVQARDTSNPSALDAFTAVTGTPDRTVAVTIDYPADTSDYALVEVRRVAGGTAPLSNCTNGSVVYSENTTFSDTSFNDDTGSTTGAAFSYRVCITDLSMNLTSTNTVVNVNAEDLTDPPNLTSFSGVTGSANGEIDLTIDFPADVSDYNQVLIRRLAGATPPTCFTGTVVRTYNVGQFTDQTPTTDTGTAGTYYSYRACIYDSSNNVTTSDVALNILANSGQWFNADRQYCPTFCTGIGRTNVNSPEGSKCASGENRPQSAIDTPVSFVWGCFGTCSSTFVYAGAESNSAPNTYCYGTIQPKDYDVTDYTIACFCQ